MNRIIALLLLASLFTSCQQNKPAEKEAATSPAETPVASKASAATLPSVPLELVQKLWNECTQVDYIFYNYPFTVSLSDQPAIQYSVRHIAETPAPEKPECQATGRVTYQINGDIVLEGNFYFSQSCTYFVFYKKQEKVYANFMTPQAVEFFNNQISQGMELQRKLEQGQQ
ncbi:MAG: hypothetical protein ACE5FF_11975 [Saprospiraceae bacterium]